ERVDVDRADHGALLLVAVLEAQVGEDVRDPDVGDRRGVRVALRDHLAALLAVADLDARRRLVVDPLAHQLRPAARERERRGRERRDTEGCRAGHPATRSRSSAGASAAPWRLRTGPGPRTGSGRRRSLSACRPRVYGPARRPTWRCARPRPPGAARPAPP